MGFAKSHSAIQKKWIVGVRGLFGVRHCRGVSKLVRSADDERLKGVARVQLMSGRIKIKLGLGRRRRVRRRRFCLGANIFELQLGTSQFGEDGLQKLAIGFRQPFAKQRRGNANDQAILLSALKTSGTKPGSEAMRVDAAFGVLKDLVPEIHRANLPFATISTAVEILWKSPTQVGGMLFCLVRQVRCHETRPASRRLMSARKICTGEASGDFA